MKFFWFSFGNDEVEGNGATCSEVDGWKAKDWKAGAWTASNMQTLKVECRESEFFVKNVISYFICL